MPLLKNNVIVVTGGKGLLGKAICDDLRKEGATVVCADIAANPKSKNEVQCDITDEQSVKNTIKTVVSTHGKLDGWVNNAYPRTQDWGSKLEDVSIESWRKNVDMHLNGYFLCCKLAGEQMAKKNKGAIVNMASIYGVVGPDFTVYEGTELTSPAAYSAIKGGIVNLTRYLASYWGQKGIRINCVSPGGIFDHQPKPFVKNYEKKVPLKRMGLPDEIAPSVSFLLSDKASYITGHNLMVDGGWTCV